MTETNNPVDAAIRCRTEGCDGSREYGSVFCEEHRVTTSEFVKQVSEGFVAVTEAHILLQGVMKALKRARALMPDSEEVRDAQSFARVTKSLVKSIGHDGRIGE